MNIPCRIRASLGNLGKVRTRTAEHLVTSTAFVSVAVVEEASTPRRSYSLDIGLAGRTLGVAIRAYAAAVIVSTPDAVLGRGIGRTAYWLATMLDHHC